MDCLASYSGARLLCAVVCFGELCYGALGAISMGLAHNGEDALIEWPMALLAFASGAVLAAAIVKRDKGYCLVW